MRPFAFRPVASAEAAVQALAGGTTLVDLMKLDVARPAALVEMGGADGELSFIAPDRDGLHIGAGADERRRGPPGRAARLPGRGRVAPAGGERAAAQHGDDGGQPPPAHALRVLPRHGLDAGPHAGGGPSDGATRVWSTRVLYAGTFNKTLAPGLRLGYLVVPDALVDAARALRAAADRHPPTLAQGVLADFVGEGQPSGRTCTAARPAYCGRDSGCRRPPRTDCRGGDQSAARPSLRLSGIRAVPPSARPRGIGGTDAAVARAPLHHSRREVVPTRRRSDSRSTAPTVAVPQYCTGFASRRAGVRRDHP